MVSNTRRTPDTRRIRRLKQPRELEVEPAEDGTPLRVSFRGIWQDVTLMRRPWRIDQHWWREDPISRVYYRVASTDGPPFTLYRDQVKGTWARQEY
jgi:hypothetical protein